jgi:hypothetical protein
MKRVIAKIDINALVKKGIGANVATLLAAIEEEKRRSMPDKKLMLQWVRQIEHLRREDNFRETYTGQTDKFMLRTSLRGWRDDI